MKVPQWITHPHKLLYIILTDFQSIFQGTLSIFLHMLLGSRMIASDFYMQVFNVSFYFISIVWAANSMGF